MPVSDRFKELSLRVDELRNHMLPETFTPTGDYTDQELDSAEAIDFLFMQNLSHILKIFPKM